MNTASRYINRLLSYYMAMNEINKQNDILVSTLLNPNADISDLIANGINSINTGLLTPEEYKNTPFIKKKFSDQNGNFDVESFNKIYQIAADKYNKLSAIKVYNDLSDISKYSDGDIYAPLNHNNIDKSYTLEKVRNPFRQTEGITSLFGKSEQKLSNRELAQQHKVWDTENQKWLDYTAEDQGLLGIKYLGRQGLVYATWDEDGTHFDKSLGRTVQHKKGEWKTDDEGMFYTETAGNRELYGKEFVAYSDILTKEDSWANKIDFFDSDDKHKSKFGTVAKTAATILPFMFPVAREVWGGVTAAIGLSTVLPTFGKMMEGLAIGDKETKFTKSMNVLENYWKKFNPSYSDESQGSMFNFEQMTNMVGDIFGQLYQMRAMASLSNLYRMRFTKAEQEGYKKFAEKFGSEWGKMMAQNPEKYTEQGFVNLWKELAEHTPEMKSLIEKQSKLSKSLSLGYMALTSSADVYEDAIQNGYDRRMAGAAGLVATAGQYGIMMNNRMGDWFLDATVGYKSDVSRNIMKKTLQPYYQEIAEAVDKMAEVGTKAEKLSTFAKLYNSVFNKGIKNFWALLRDGGEEYWKRSIIEGVEEVTEEAVMDTTKGIFDFLSWAGVGSNAGNASFHTIENTFSSEGAQRYLMNFIGGVMGGALFEFQGKVIQPYMDALISGKAVPEAQYSIVKEIMNGHTNELLEEIDRMAKVDDQSINLEVDINSTKSNPSANGQQQTRGEAIAKVLKDYVHFVEGVVVDNGIKVSDSDLLQKVVRDRLVQPIIEDSGVLKIMIDDFTKLSSDLVTAQAKLDEYNSKEAEKPEKESKENKQDNKQENKVEMNPTDPSVLRTSFNEAKQRLQEFLNGERAEDYLKISLAYLQKPIRDAILGMDKYSWTQAVYGKNYSDLPETDAALSKQQIDKEYEEWKDKSDDVQKFKTVGVNVYDEMQKEFSSALYEYAESLYKDIRDQVMKEVFGEESNESGLNFTIGQNVHDVPWRNKILRLSQKLALAGLPGISLEDKLKISDKAKQRIVEKLMNKNSKFFIDMAKIIESERKKQIQEIPEEIRQHIQEDLTEELTPEDYKKQFEQTLFDELSKIPVETLTAETLNQIIINSANRPYAVAFTREIKKNIPENATPEQAKQIVDIKLVEYGFSPEQSIIFTDNKDLDLQIEGYVSAITSPKVSLDQVYDLSDGILESYIESKDVIDNEILIRIKAKVLQDVFNQRTAFKSAIQAASGGQISVSTQAFDDLYTTLYEGINQNQDIKSIVKTWMESIIDSDEDFADEADELKEDAWVTIEQILNEIDSINLYNTAIQKSAKSNPLYDSLRQIGMKVFDGEDMKIFDLLQQESTYMSQLPDLQEYIRQGITKEAIDNFLIKLDLLKALTVGMEEVNIDPEHQFGFNVQMKRWTEKYNEGKNADKYKTIDTNSVRSILRDIDLIENKLQFAKTLIETNTESKLASNKKIKEKFEQYTVSWFKDNASKLTIDGISILPPLDEIDKKEDDEEKLNFIEHTIRQKVTELLRSGKTSKQIVDQLFTNLEVNRAEILNKGLQSEQFNSDSWTGFSSYDMFVYLTTILASDAYEFDTKLIEVFGLDTYQHIPFFTQQYAAKVGYSFASDKNGIHKAAVDWLYQGASNPGNQKADNIFFINGIAGAGKTSAVMSLIASMLGKQNVMIAAPTEGQASKLKDSLSTNATWISESPVYDKQKLLQFFFTDQGIQALQDALTGPGEDKVIKSVESGDALAFVSEIPDTFIKEIAKEQLPKVIFIDEITHFSQPELIALDKVASKYGIKILTSGDTLQKGITISDAPANITEVFSFKTPALTVSVRSNNIHNKDNVDLMQSSLRQAENWFLENDKYDPKNPTVQQFLSNIQLKYFQTGSELDGAKISPNDLSLDDIRSISQAAKSKNASLAIIANLDSDGNIADQNLLVKLKDAGLKDTDYEVYTPDSLHKKAVQGSEADYVIVWNMPDPIQGDKYQSLINLYTYSSRALIGTLVRDKNNAYKNLLGFVNLKINYTGPYETPGLDQQKSLKDERIQKLKKIIGNYVIPSQPEPIKPVVQTTPTTTVIQEELDPTTEKIIQSAIEIGETNSVEATKDEEKRPKLSEANPDSYKPDVLFGWGFYNHCNTVRDQGGQHYSLNTGSSWDLDGLFGDKRVYISPIVISGFIKFKNLIALYPDTSSEQFRQGFNDHDILIFFDRINPSVSNAEHQQDRFEDIKDYYLGTEENPGKLHVEQGTYIYAKRYNPNSDNSARTVGSENNPLTEKDVFFGYGKRVYTDDGSINQYITLGSLPRIATLDRRHIDAPEYKEFVTNVTKSIGDSKEIKVFKLSTEITPRTNLTLIADKQRFVTVRDMLYHYGISFEEYEDEDNVGLPVIGLITDNMSTVKGVRSYDILHYIASVETSPLSYEERIKQLESAFVKDGKLTITGKYFATAKLTKVDDPNFRRVLILEPNQYTFREALAYQRQLSEQVNRNNGEPTSGILEEKAKAMSQASQKRLLTSAFIALGCIDESGLAIGNGVLPYVEHTLNYLETIQGARFRNIVNDIRDLIQEWKNAGKDFDMDFISAAMGRKLDIEEDDDQHDIRKRIHNFGILLIDNHISFANDVVKARLLPEPGKERRALKDMEFDVDSPSYREFGVRYQKITKKVDEDFTYETIQVNVSEKDLSNIGLSNHKLEMPIYEIPSTSFGSMRELSTTESRLSHKPISFENLDKIQEEKSKKIPPTTSTIEQLRKDFSPEYGLTIESKSKKIGRDGFYRPVILSKEEFSDRLKFTAKPKDTNGFEVREGDIIQVCGDPTHTYRVSYVDVKKKRLQFDMMDGHEANIEGHKSCKFSDVSNVLSREIPRWSTSSQSKLIGEDYYQSQKYKDLVAKVKESKKESSKIVSRYNFTDDQLRKIAKSNGLIILYTVKDTDNSVLTPIENAISAIENQDATGFQVIDSGKDPNWSEEELQQHIEETISKIKESVDILEQGDNINGIAIIGLRGDKVAQWVNKPQDVLNTITENYITKYISYTTDPKLTNPQTVEETSVDSGPKRKTEGPAKKETSTQEDKVKSLATTSLDFTDFSQKIFNEFIADQKEDLKDFSNHKYYVYLGKDNKWHVLPKLSYLKTLFESANKDFEAFKESIPKATPLVGDNIIYRLLSGEERKATISAIRNDSVDITYNTNESNAHTIAKSFEEYDLLQNIQFFAAEQKVPVNPNTSIENEDKMVELPIEFEVVVDKFGEEKARIIYSKIGDVASSYIEQSSDPNLFDFIHEDLEEFTIWLLEVDSTSVQDILDLLSNQDNMNIVLDIIQKIPHESLSDLFTWDGTTFDNQCD